MAEKSENAKETRPADIGRVIMSAQREHEKIASVVRVVQLARDMEREAVLLRLKNAL